MIWKDEEKAVLEEENQFHNNQTNDDTQFLIIYDHLQDYATTNTTTRPTDTLSNDSSIDVVSYEPRHSNPTIKGRHWTNMGIAVTAFSLLLWWINHPNQNVPLQSIPTEHEKIISIQPPSLPSPPAAPDGNLRILLSDGCSGSTFISTQIQHLLGIHGYNIDHRWQTEIYRPFKNHMFQVVQQQNTNRNATELDLVMNATLLLNQESMNHGQFTFFKWKWDIFPPLVQYVHHFSSSEILHAGLVRENVLDRLICRIQDCFTNYAGYTVYANNGTESHLCFERRKTPDVKTNVYFHVDLLPSVLKHEIAHVNLLKSQPETVTYEELTALEYTDDETVFEQSALAWEKLIGQYVNVVDRDKIRNSLSSIRNTRNESYQEDSIQNYEDVLHALKKANLDHYLRKRSIKY